MDGLSHETLRELAEWRPEGGVVSVYLDVDPADRGGGWRIELHERLKEIVKAANTTERRQALEAACGRILARFPEDGAPPPGRVQVGFAEAAEDGREVWHGIQTHIDRSRVVHAPTPCLAPLVRILDGGGPVGVVLIAHDDARAFEWSLGRLSALGSWELEMFSGDWRERKSPQRNPQAGGTGTTAAGRDQYAQRLENNRARFVKEVGQLLGSEYGDRGWGRIVVFGEGDLPRLLSSALGPRGALVHEVHHDLIHAPDPEVEERVEHEIAAITEERERALVQRVEEAIGSEHGAALGPEEVLQALEEGRASHLIFDSSREFESLDGEPTVELMISRALTTGAEVIPVEGEPAARLAPRDGAVALLRY